MNIVVIFAGGTGQRMHTKDKPKQFLMIHGKPIIVHTIEIFQNHPEIDGIIVSCIKEWIPFMEEMQYQFRLDKIMKIVPGGDTGQLSIFNGIQAACDVFGEGDHVVLIHDGVRPLITEALISDNIRSVKENGSAITCAPAKETVVLVEGNQVETVVERSTSLIAKAPQSFWLKEVYEAEKQAINDGYTNMIDTCTLMSHYGKKLHVVHGNSENIKITTSEDFYTFRAIYDAKENEQLQ